jgi:hypothetical protein
MNGADDALAANLRGLPRPLQLATRPRFSFELTVVAGSIVPCLTTVVFVGLVRRGSSRDPNRVLLDF